MAPPMTDLGGKETNQDIKVIFPSAVEAQPPKVNNKKYKYISVAIIVSVLVITAGILGSVALYQHLNPRQKELYIEPTYDNVKVPEQVKIDHNRKMIIINNTQHGDIVASYILHDYQKKILAYKDLTNKKCYLDTTSDSFDDYLTQLAEIDSKTETFVVNRKRSKFSIEQDVLKKFVGEDIADHCKGYPTYWLVEDDDVCDSGELCRMKRRLRISGSVRVSFANGKFKVRVRISISF